MLKAWALGIGLLLAADAIWFICLQAKVFSAVFLLLVQISPLIAALVSATLAPRKKVLLGTSMALPAAVLATVLNFAYQLLGNVVDFSGFRGGLILFTISLIYGIAICAVGGFGGYLLSRKFPRAQGVTS